MKEFFVFNVLCSFLFCLVFSITGAFIPGSVGDKEAFPLWLSSFEQSYSNAE